MAEWGWGILAPRCPGCDALPALVVGDQQAFCGNDGCRVFTWDMCQPPERFKATCQVVDLGLGRLIDGDPG